MQANTLSGGFTKPAAQSAHAFRSVLEAMARPGTIQDIEGAAPPCPDVARDGRCSADALRYGNTGLSGWWHGLQSGADVAGLSHWRPVCWPHPLHVCDWPLGRACAARGVPDRHLRIP
jgi:hypothetical protein